MRLASRTRWGWWPKGSPAAPSVLALAREHGVEMPIVENVVAVVFDGKSVQTSVRDLMTRQPRSEFR